MDIAPALLENTHTVEFYHAANNLTICADVVALNPAAAERFARNRFKLESPSWELVGVDKKYDRARSSVG